MAEIPAWRKVRKAFYGLAKFATVCSNLTKLLSGFVRLGEVCPDFTVFTETSAQCVAKGALRSDSLKIKDYNADDQFQSMTGKLESMTISPQAH